MASLESSQSCWSDLPQDLLELIFDFTKDPIDILCCGAACKSWLPIALRVYQRFLHLCMIQVMEDDQIGGACYLFNILTKQTRKIKLPEARGQAKIFCSSTSSSWVLTVDNFASSNRLFRMHLLNVFSGKQINLPHYHFKLGQKSFESSYWTFFLSECPSSSDCIIVLHYDDGSHDFDQISIISMCKPNEKSWTEWKFGWWSNMIDINLHKGVIYVYHDHGFGRIKEICAVSLYDDSDVLVLEYDLGFHTHTTDAFLVKSLGGHLLLVRYRRKDPSGKFFDVFIWDDDSEEFVWDDSEDCISEANELDGCTLFISPNGNHLLAKPENFETWFKANCIYFFRYMEEDHSYLVYDLETKHTEFVPLV